MPRNAGQGSPVGSRTSEGRGISEPIRAAAASRSAAWNGRRATGLVDSRGADDDASVPLRDVLTAEIRRQM